MERSRILPCLLPLLLGCSSSLHLPRDPNETLNRLQAGTLRVGVSHMPPWTDTKSGISGIEVELVNELAAQLQAEVQWVELSEGRLLRRLEHGELDLVVAGLLSDTPWADKVALTKPLAESVRGEETLEHVWALPPGENGWLLRVEKFLAGRRERVARLLEEQG